MIGECTVARATLPLSRSASPPASMSLQIEPLVQMSRGSDDPQTEQERLAKV